MRQALALAALGAVAACSSPEVIAQDTSVAVARAQSSGAVAGADGSAAPGPYQYNNSEKTDEGERTFVYEWPRQVAEIPRLAAKLDKERKQALAEQMDYWAETLQSCPPDGMSCRSAAFEVKWQVVADTPRFLSLSNNFYTYTGGAHGMHGRGALLWDREAERSLTSLDFFASPFALGDAIGAAACKSLNREREARRGEPVPAGATEWPNQCPSMEETVVFLGSSNGTTFDRIGVYYGPYVAGSYAEGEFEFTLPVTKAVLSTVKPEYRAAFAIE